MSLFRKLISVFLILLFLCIPMKADAASSGMEDYIQRMIQYYLRFGQEAEGEIVP